VRRLILGASALALLFAAPATTHAQQREITGRVTQAGSGIPLPDINIGIVGALAGTRSNERGEFRIRVPSGDVTLFARAIGFKRATKRVGAGEATADFQLDKDVLLLEGVTVTGATTTTERRNATSAVSSVSGDQLTKVPAVSIENALQGKVLGAQISMNNGAPGGGAQIQVRGASSLLGRIDPLIVVDGVVISNDVRSNRQRLITGSLSEGEENGTNRLADINPNDIETVEILKGATASAIYGSQATNGVVVITTKRGHSGAPRFTVTQRMGQYSLARNKGTRRFTDLADVTEALDAVGATKEARDSAAAVCNPSCPYYDNVGNFYGRKDLSYETIATMSGGVASTKYYVSASNRNEAGTAENTGARRWSLRANVDQAVGSKITVNVNSSLMRSLSERGISNNDNANSSPMYAFAYTPAILNLNARAVDGSFPVNPFYGGRLTITNPFQTFALMSNEEDVYRLIAGANVNYAAWSSAKHDVRFTVQTGVDRSQNESYQFYPRELQMMQPGHSSGDGNYPGAVVQGNGDVYLTNTAVSGTWQYTPSAKWLTATTTAGVQYGDRKTNDYNLVQQGLIPTVTSATGGVNTISSHARTGVRNAAWFVQGDFLTLDERLAFNAAVRSEKSSVNGDPEKQYVFPRFGASYRFVEPVANVTEFKLRGLIGQAGNQPSYGDRFLVLTNGGQIGGQTGLIQATTIGNPGIKPEIQREFEYGFDAGFLRDRVRAEFTTFRRDITDLLVRPIIASSTGVTQTTINGGRMRTQGYEAGLTLVPVQTTNLLWTSRTNYQSNTSKIISFPEGVLPFRYTDASGGFGGYGRLRFTPGQSVSAIYGNEERPDGTVARDTVLGDANPKYTVGFSNDFQWKSWSLSSLVDWRHGGEVVNMTLNLMDEAHNSWDYTKPSPDPALGATLGEWRYNKFDGGTNSSVYLMDASFVKVREITLAYDLPKSMIAKLPASSSVSSLRLSLSGRNLFTFTGYNGYDPEVNNGGQRVARTTDLGAWPPVKNFFFSIDVGF
jgi:TonB-dependent starch-binding outer membrane protein SusC